MKQVRQRTVDEAAQQRLLQGGIHPVLARVAASRGVRDPASLAPGMDGLLKPAQMGGLAAAARCLGDAIRAGQRLLVVGDYDCDGATATAVCVSGLRRLGARIDYLVPNRFTDGYGLSPAVVRAALEHPRLGRPDWIITVDNGIASLEGVATANALGMRVVITDHHLPGERLPAAAAIVNPNLPDCGFPSRHLAGVGVAFYVVAAVRGDLLASGHLSEPAPKLVDLLDLVALGTVADVVRLDENNRRLVQAGLARCRAGKARPGLQALIEQAGCSTHRLSTRDLGFALGPRINAAGRLEDITQGIECLLADSAEAAMPLARALDELNRQRRTVEAAMREQAMDAVAASGDTDWCVVAHQSDWHEGVVGLVAGRLRERYHRPAFAFAPASQQAGHWRGSGRSIPGVHLRDVLARIDAREPGLIERFGGHAMAAGLSLAQTSLARFRAALPHAIEELCDRSVFEEWIAIDGPLAPADCTLAVSDLLERQIWGQGFEAPRFCNRFMVRRQRVVGSGHLKLSLVLDGQPLEGIFFGRGEPLPDQCDLVFQLQGNEYRGVRDVQVLVEATLQDR